MSRAQMGAGGMDPSGVRRSPSFTPLPPPPAPARAPRPSGRVRVGQIQQPMLGMELSLYSTTFQKASVRGGWPRPHLRACVRVFGWGLHSEALSHKQRGSQRQKYRIACSSALAMCSVTVAQSLLSKWCCVPQWQAPPVSAWLLPPTAKQPCRESATAAR